jgi:ADP-heptose:LPS heptosyltransferase
MPNLERIIVFSKQPFGQHWIPLWATTVTCWWDLVIDIRGSALPWLIPARRRASMRPGIGHKTLQLAKVLRLNPAPLPVAWFGPDDANRAFSLYVPGRPVIVLAPTANWAPKVWPAERFAALFRRLAETEIEGAVAAIIAGPGPTEAAMAKPLLDALPDAINLIGCLSLPEIAAFLSRSRLFVGNDSGLMHLAAASGTCTLGLFGPTSAEEYAPAGQCAAALAGPRATMDSITVDAASEAARRLLAS